MKTWLKGALIFLGIVIVLIILDQITLLFIQPGGMVGRVDTPFSLPLVIIGLPLAFLIGRGPPSIFFIALIPYSFILGAIIGWIIGKIKSKKK